MRVSTIANPPGGAGCDIQPLSSSQQPPAGGSSDMESGGRCLYRQHYTYTAHIYTNFKFGIPYTVSKMEKRLSTEANSLPSLMCISPLCWLVGIGTPVVDSHIFKNIILLYCTIDMEVGGWPRCDLNPTITFILMFLTDNSLSGLSTLRTGT